MSIFKDTFKQGVQDQIKARQEAIFERTPNAIQYYNSRNAWIRMTSAVNVGNDNGTLAKQYVLLGGVINNNGTLKSGIGNTINNAYSTITPGGGTNRLGIRPMPGITSIDVQSMSPYGSLRTITVNFNAWDIRQLEDLELLYMRQGYTVLIEWGWAPYLTNNKGLENNIQFNNDVLNGGKSKNDIWKDIFTKSSKDGNYDAMYGKIQNYSWKARNDGGYDCTTTIVSIGEVMNSLKVNYVPADQPNIEKIGILASRIKEIQGLNLQSEISGSYSKNIVAGICHELYAIANKKTENNQSYKIVDRNKDGTFSDYHFYKLSVPFTNINVSKTTIVKDNAQIYITLGSFIEILNNYVLLEDIKSKNSYVKLSVKESSITSDGKKDLLCLGNKYQISTDLSVCLIANEAWLNPEGELGIKGSFVTLQTFTKNATQKYFYNDLNNKYQFGIIGNIYVNLDYLYSLVTDDNVASQDPNEKNNIPVYKFVKDIMFGISKAIGNVANFDLHVDPIDNNIAKIIDVNYIDTISRKEAYDNAFKFEMYNTKSIVRNYSLESQIFPSQGYIVAMGAQVQGGVIGADTNTLVDFNQNLTDRIIPKTDAPTSSTTDIADNIKNKIDNLTKNLNIIIVFITGLDTSTSEGGGFDISKTSEYYSALRDIINFYKGFIKVNNKNRSLIPTKLSLEIDGIGGLVIGNLFKIPDELLPRGYKGEGGVGAKIAFGVTRLGHSIQNNDWITKIDSQFIILDDPKSGFNESEFQQIQKQVVSSVQAGNIEEAKETIQKAVEESKGNPNQRQAPGPPSKDIPPNLTVDKVIAAMQRKGYSFYSNTNYGRNKLNIVGIRNLEKIAGKSVTNYFSDIIVMFYYDDKGTRYERIGRFTSVPGLYYQGKKFGNDDGKTPQNRLRTISIKEGQYKGAYYQGTHGSKRKQPKAMRQSSKLPYIQDRSLNNIYNNDGFETAINYTNIHNSGDYSANDPKKLINNWSAGCQVFRSINDFNWMGQAADNQMNKTGLKLFDYTLLNIKDIPGFENITTPV